jgi:asparagine synthase (glutamine-hydrolysing)
MCGIFGIASTRLEDGNYTAYTNTLSHRGPDAYGDYQNDNVFLGHRRLSIIDLEGGVQPFFNESKSLAIIFNGEIYNYKAIRQSLIHKGYQFVSNSDTETIPVAYQEWGERCVQYFEGMFAFAIWDDVSKRLFIARDRLGIKLNHSYTLSIIAS